MSPAGAPPAAFSARRALIALGSGAALVLIAFVFDAAPLFVPGIGLAAIGAVIPPWVWASARGARVRRLLPVTTVVEGEVLAAKIEVTRSRIPIGLPGAQVLDPFSGRALAVSGAGLPQHRRGRTTTIDVRGRLDRRGEHRLAAPSLQATDPFGLAAVHVPGGGSSDTVLVLPRTERVHWLAGAGALRSDRANGDAAGEALAATDLEGLRPYRPGTPASRIHWPALARGHGLIERRLLADGDSRPLVVLDGRHHDHEGGRVALDAAVRAAGSLALELARTGGCGVLLPGDQRPTMLDAELAAWPSLHARLARVGASFSVPIPRIVPSAGRGPVIYVAAMTGERLVAGLGRAHRQTVIVLPDTALRGERPEGISVGATVLRVTGCRGFMLRGRSRGGEFRTAAAGPA